MNLTLGNTLLGLDLFEEEIKESTILHIPHSSTFIPDRSGYNDELLDKEIDLLTDHDTDKIFNIEGVDKIIFPYSRLYCDVERLSDEIEPMFKFGKGFYYTHTENGEKLRNEENKEYIYNNIYKPYHEKLTSIVEEKLNKNGFVTIIDCHSFPNKPLNSDSFKDDNRPDICIGVDDFHTPQFLIDMVYNHFKNMGFTILINNPYKGTIVPLKFYKKEPKVYSIMIEINRKLYL